MGDVFYRSDRDGRLTHPEDLAAVEAAAALAIEEEVPPGVEFRVIRGLTVTVSLGGAVHAGESTDALIARADDALYDAKERGRNLVVLAEA